MSDAREPTAPRSSRRSALRTAALGAGVVAAGSLLRPIAAFAQTEEETDMRDFLVEAVGRSQIAVLAYNLAADTDGTQPPLRPTLTKLRDQDQAHANAFRQALDSLGFDPPEPPDSAEDSGVFDDVEGLDDEAASAFDDSLAELAKIEKLEDYLAYLAALEDEQITYLKDNAAGLDSEDLPTTAAEIIGSLSQHLVVLGEAQGEDPLKLLLAADAAAAKQT